MATSPDIHAIALLQLYAVYTLRAGVRAETLVSHITKIQIIFGFANIIQNKISKLTYFNILANIVECVGSGQYRTVEHLYKH